MTTIQAFILAIIEGVTEYLPISSTGHMIFASSYFGIQNDDFVKLFQVSIQFGAILAVVALYWKKFFDFSKFPLESSDFSDAEHLRHTGANKFSKWLNTFIKSGQISSPRNHKITFD